jgi:putative membrane protein
MRQTVRGIILIATMVSAGLVACDDADDDTTTGTNNVGAGGDGGAGGRGGDTSGGGTAGAGGGTAGGEGSNAGAGSARDGGTSGSDDDGAAQDDGAAGGDVDAAAPEVDLTDAQIGAVTTAANTGEVAQANAALPKLTHSDAKAFAQEMVTAHTAAQTRQAALLQSKGITPVENEVSMGLRQESDTIVAELTAATTEVDLLYMEAQVAVHTKVLETLDAILIPSADEADLKAELEATRGEVKAHLDHAQEILDELQR